MSELAIFVLTGLATAGVIAEREKAGIPDIPFIQEYHEPYPVRQPNEPKINPSTNDIRALAIDKAGGVWAATKAGVFLLRVGAWARQADVTDGPAYDIFVDDEGVVWVAAWDGVYRIGESGAEKAQGVDGPVSVIAAVPGGMAALGPDGAWRSTNGQWQRITDPWSRNVRDMVVGLDGDWWIATGMGLYRVSENGVRHYHREDELLTGALDAVAFAPDGQLWIGGWGGIDVYEHGVRVASFTGKEGLPHYDVRSLTFAPDGTLWAGTALGVARYNPSPAFLAQNNGSPWSLRHSRRWLLSNDVRDVAIAPDGTAWIATASGVSAIKRRAMTLADKAAYYLDICLKRHVRPPYLVEKCFFPNPEDRSVFQPRDDDNDGQYTSMYLAMESFRYAVTKDPQAKANADQSYDALEFLQTVTGTDGFVARTVVPSDWKRMADPNERVTPQECVERRVRDPRWKKVEQRWRPSADGKWLWKGDTSSDEITGHMFGYFYYFDLAADETRRDRVRKHVGKIMDYIIGGGYMLRDIDGAHTRWAVWSPEKLKDDPDWRVERYINAFEMLSFLRVAHHITGDPKYQGEYRRLIEQHGYAEMARRPKTYGISERSHIDDELMALAAPGLVLNEDDPHLRALYLEGFTWAYQTIENDQNPFSNFVFGALGGADFHLDESVAFLRDAPLDLVQWRVDNSEREDIRLVRRPMLEPLQTSRMLPPSERGVMRWDKNPWEVVSGDFCDEKGSLESSGVFWLLPYWMGRYYGFIQAPK